MRKLQFVLACLVSLSMLTSAHALLTVQISDNSSFTGTVVSAVDTDGDGMVTLSSALGGTSVWIANVVTGFSAPLLGSEYVEEIDLNSVNVSGGTGTIYIRLIEDAMTKNVAPYIASLGGTTDGSVSFKATATDNVTGTSTELLSYTGNNAFANEQSGNLALQGDYTAMLYAAITHGSGVNVSSFDFNLKVPEPGSLALLGLGLIGLGFGAKRRK